MSENMRSRNVSGDMEDIILYRYTRLKISVLMLPREKGYDFFFFLKGHCTSQPLYINYSKYKAFFNAVINKTYVTRLDCDSLPKIKYCLPNILS